MKYEIARDTRSGKFISLAEAERNPATSVVDVIDVPRNGARRLKARIVGDEIVLEPVTYPSTNRGEHP